LGLHFSAAASAGLGIAFRNKPADVTSVVIIDGAGAQKTLMMLQAVPGKSSPDKGSSIRAIVLDREAALKGFHFGKFDLAIESNSDGSYTYYYDPRGRRAFFRAPKSTRRCNRPLGARMRSQLPRSLPANRVPATSIF